MKEINLNDWEILETISVSDYFPWKTYFIRDRYIGARYNVRVYPQTGDIKIKYIYSDDKVKVKNVKLITEVFNLWMKLKEIAE